MRKLIILLSVVITFSFISIVWSRDNRGGPNPRVWRDQTAAPTVNDDSGKGYRIGDIWVDTTNDNSYILQDTTQGAAVWTHVQAYDVDTAKTDTAQTWTADQTIPNVHASMFRGGASIYAGPASGTTFVSTELNIIVLNDQTTSQIYWLPSISGVSIIYFKFSESAYGSGITLYPADSEPFMDVGESGASYLALPPGNPFEEVILFGYDSGDTKYWKFDGGSNWSAG